MRKKIHVKWDSRQQEYYIVSMENIESVYSSSVNNGSAKGSATIHNPWLSARDVQGAIGGKINVVISK